MRRWRERYEEDGYDGLYDRRKTAAESEAGGHIRRASWMQEVATRPPRRGSLLQTQDFQWNTERRCYFRRSRFTVDRL